MAANVWPYPLPQEQRNTLVTVTDKERLELFAESRVDTGCQSDRGGTCEGTRTGAGWEFNAI